MSWYSDQRAEKVRELVLQNGAINRQDIADFFHVSIQTASGDIGRALKRWPGLMRYDKTAKRYVANRQNGGGHGEE
jgi:hypothetical protein